MVGVEGEDSGNHRINLMVEWGICSEPKKTRSLPCESEVYGVSHSVKQSANRVQYLSFLVNGKSGVQAACGAGSMSGVSYPLGSAFQ